MPLAPHRTPLDPDLPSQGVALNAGFTPNLRLELHPRTPPLTLLRSLQLYPERLLEYSLHPQFPEELWDETLTQVPEDVWQEDYITRLSMLVGHPSLWTLPARNPWTPVEDLEALLQQGGWKRALVLLNPSCPDVELKETDDLVALSRVATYHSAHFQKQLALRGSREVLRNMLQGQGLDSEVESIVLGRLGGVVAQAALLQGRTVAALEPIPAKKVAINTTPTPRVSGMKEAVGGALLKSLVEQVTDRLPAAARAAGAEALKSVSGLEGVAAAAQEVAVADMTDSVLGRLTKSRAGC